MAAFKQHWQQVAVDTEAGELAYTIFPGPSPFIGATTLDGTPIAPTTAHGLLKRLRHEHASLAHMGGGVPFAPWPRANSNV